jgi:hypothetical protein
MNYAKIKLLDPKKIKKIFDLRSKHINLGTVNVNFSK